MSVSKIILCMALIFVAMPACYAAEVPLPCDPVDCPPIDPCKIAPERCNPPNGEPIGAKSLEIESTGMDFRGNACKDKPEACAAEFCSAPGTLNTATDADSIYWTNYGAGTVMMISRLGGETKTLAANQGGPCAIAVQGKSVFWTNTVSGDVMTASSSGGPASAVATKQIHPIALAVGAWKIFWAGGDGIKSAPIGQSLAGYDESNGYGCGFVSKICSWSSCNCQPNPGGTIHCDLCPNYCDVFSCGGK